MSEETESLPIGHVLQRRVRYASGLHDFFNRIESRRSHVTERPLPRAPQGSLFANSFACCAV